MDYFTKFGLKQCTADLSEPHRRTVQEACRVLEGDQFYSKRIDREPAEPDEALVAVGIQLCWRTGMYPESPAVEKPFAHGAFVRAAANERDGWIRLFGSSLDAVHKIGEFRALDPVELSILVDVRLSTMPRPALIGALCLFQDSRADPAVFLCYHPHLCLELVATVFRNCLPELKPLLR